MSLIYSFVIHIIYILIYPAALLNKKARLWISGRKHWKRKLKKWQHKGSPRFWFHAASLGEFEQGLPVMEGLKNQIPDCEILLTFYSPSGYEVKKNYQKADFVSYLPLDTKYNAREFIRIAKPDAAFFIKYEFWYFYLYQLYAEGIPAYLISGIFRPEQIFFRWYGSWYRKELLFFRHLFLQDNSSSELLKKIGISKTSITGDTRFDRVVTKATAITQVEIARAFAAQNICVVAGSSWPEDEDLLIPYILNASATTKFIIAPHEVNPSHIGRLISRLTGKFILYSAATTDNVADKQVLIIDNIGLLSSLYQYGHIAYIGGGFGKGIHNILEAAVFGIPVIFGPNYERFREAIEMIDAGCAFSVGSAPELKKTADELIERAEIYNIASTRAREYVYSHVGASQKILAYVKKDLLL